MTIDANRGNIAEVILGAAVTAKFHTAPVSVVTYNMVTEILRKIIGDNKIILSRADRTSRETNVSDKIRFAVAVPAKDWKFMSAPSNWPAVRDLFNSAIKYVNSDRRLGLQASVLFTNQKYNDIFINADGTGDQKGTKADIKLEIDGKQTVNQLSLKVSGGEQFAQVAGVTFEKQVTLWGKLGIDVAKAKPNYDKYFKRINLETRFSSRSLINDSDVKDNLRLAASEAYKIATKQLQIGFKNSDNNLINGLASFIRFSATLDDPNIELVKLTAGGSFKRAKFGKQFQENMLAFIPNLKVEYSRLTDPIVNIYDPSIGNSSSAKARLIRIRGKYSAEATKFQGEKVYRAYFRNIVEAGDLMFQIATDR
tara:strand:+ start:244 stop:1344 length:1101 start_codon:yes stop_codon:yes gene_type:complete